MTELEDALQVYEAARDEVRELVLGSALAKRPLVAAQAAYFLRMNEVSAYNFYIAPRQAYPKLYVHSIFMPYEISTGQACPDFLYRWSFLDGRCSYRIRGRRGTTIWTDIQITNGYWGDERMETLGNFTLEELDADDEGRFDIFLSAEKRPGNWLPLDPASTNNMLLSRETWGDWESERGVEMQIERIEPEGNFPIIHDEARMAERLKAAARYMKFSANFSVGTTQRIIDGAGGTNRFFDITGAKERQKSKVGGSNPQAQMAMMIYEIEPDQALIIETDVPRARYWGISLGDVWFASIDYTHHQSSLNMRQARLDADGRFRCVIALEDPGVPNWVDPDGQCFGLVILRRYLADSHPVPDVKLVPATDLRRYLPSDTPTVGADTRRQQLRRRERASNRRYGF